MCLPSICSFELVYRRRSWIYINCQFIMFIQFVPSSLGIAFHWIYSLVWRSPVNRIALIIINNNHTIAGIIASAHCEPHLFSYLFKIDVQSFAQRWIILFAVCRQCAAAARCEPMTMTKFSCAGIRCHAEWQIIKSGVSVTVCLCVYVCVFAM